jgi:hypothetical protein
MSTHRGKKTAKSMAEKVLGRKCPDFSFSDYWSGVYFMDCPKRDVNSVVREVKRVLDGQRFKNN